MSDTEKIDVVKNVIRDAWDCMPTRKEDKVGYFEGIIICIETVLNHIGDGE